MEYPPKSGKYQEFPEIDKGEWFDYATAKEKINIAQKSFLDELISKLNLKKEQIIK